MPLTILPGLEIPDDELEITASRSGGPGGQHVNTTSSRVAIRFDVLHSPTLSPEARRLAARRLASRLAADGSVRVVAQDSRSQRANRETALGRLAALLARALTPPKPRVATAVPRRERAGRAEAKRRRGEVKRGRAPVGDREREG